MLVLSQIVMQERNFQLTKISVLVEINAHWEFIDKFNEYVTE